MTDRRTQGVCGLCGNRLGMTQMTRHLEACIVEAGRGGRHPDRGRRDRGPGAFLIAVDCPHAPDYWMHLLAPGRATLEDLDGLLRASWLECCGHLSGFGIGGKRYESYPETSMGDRHMRFRLSKVLAPGMVLTHEYDYGTSTELRLGVVSRLEAGPSRGSVRVLARNEPPEIACDVCGNPATQVCPQCMYGGEPWLCEVCAEDHACGEDMLLPVVNSPRCGVCGYCGEER